MKVGTGHMRDQSEGGNVLNTLALAGIFGALYIVGHIVADYGVVGLIRSAAAEHCPVEVRVNAICPDLVMRPQVGDNLNRAIVAADGGLTACFQ